MEHPSALNQGKDLGLPLPCIQVRYQHDGQEKMLLNLVGTVVMSANLTVVFRQNSKGGHGHFILHEPSGAMYPIGLTKEAMPVLVTRVAAPPHRISEPDE